MLYDGTLEPARCGRSNVCGYCAKCSAVETSLMLRLDAELNQPTVGITTTTRRPDFPLDQLRRAEERLWRALRKGHAIKKGRRTRNERVLAAFPELQYCGFLEWTTGEGTHAGGHRRPHIHHLVKGIPADHPLIEVRSREDGTTYTPLEERVSELWQSYTGDAYIVDCRRLRTPAGAIAYLALHHNKTTQAPPVGFKGRRLRLSRGYLERPNKEMRLLARRLASDRRIVDAVDRAIAQELYGVELATDVDAELTSALVEGLRSLASKPLELQIDIDGNVDHITERKELAARTAAELKRLRKAHPPELVYVREREETDQRTGITYRRATAILGPVVARPPAVASYIEAAA